MNEEKRQNTGDRRQIPRDRRRAVDGGAVEVEKRQGVERRQTGERRHHSSHSHHHHHRTHRSEIKKTVKLMLLIAGICLIIALVVSFMIGKVPSFIETTVSKQIEGEIERTVGKGADIDKLKKKYREFMK